MFQLHNYAIGLAFWLFLLWPAFGQDHPSPREQAFSSRILTEVNANLTCTTELIALREALTKAEAELKKLQEAPKP